MAFLQDKITTLKGHRVHIDGKNVKINQTAKFIKEAHLTYLNNEIETAGKQQLDKSSAHEGRNSLEIELESEGETNHSSNEDLTSQPRHYDRTSRQIYVFG